MNVKEAYKDWSQQYDSNENKTRDLEALALRSVLSTINFNKVLEFGCGTGKNTIWLKDKAKSILAADFSEEMISKAKEKINSSNVQFTIADINKAWNFTADKFDLVSFSLVLEHIENLEAVFEKIKASTNNNAFIYIGELHPFKQYTGSVARFMTEQGEQKVTCFTHHISAYITAAKKNGFELYLLEEWFDDDDKTQIPRILTLLFKKK
jgi:ubiquinone/menaquinone biosynthesis C-methylase UbiE